MRVAKGRAAWKREGLVSSREAQRKKKNKQSSNPSRTMAFYVIEELVKIDNVGNNIPTEIQLTELV